MEIGLKYGVFMDECEFFPFLTLLSIRINIRIVYGMYNMK